MRNVSPPAADSASMIHSFLALGLGLGAAAIAGFDALFHVSWPTPYAPSLVIVAMGAISVGLRELSVRAQFARQANDQAKALRELEKRIQWLTVTEAHTQVGHWRLDLSSETVFWSEGTFAIHGLEPTETPSLEAALDFYHSEDRHIVIETIEDARRTGKPYTFKARLIRPDGETRYVDAGARVECSSEGKPIALFGVIKDRTTEEEMQGQLRAARDKAKALAAAKGQFLARMSHEIRTPMNAVLGYAELLGQSDLSPDQSHKAELIINCGRSLQILLDDILDLSKIEMGSIRLAPSRVDIADLAKDAIKIAQPLAENKGIDLLYEAQSDLPQHIMVDAIRVRQILSNLLSNAVRFTDRGSVTVSLTRSDQTLQLSVADTGTGIASAMQEVIFDPLAQEPPDKSLSRGGTGIGLSISRNLARLMGGTLEVESEVGAGTVFTLALPLIPADSPTPPNALPVQPAGALSGPQHRVLLVEDHDINRELVTEMARKLGVEIECAIDGSEAVSMVHQARDSHAPYRLVLMDLQMPRLDGLEATQRLRAAGIDESELAIVALTANAFADDVEACMAAGMQAHLAKPVSMAQLSLTLQQWTANERSLADTR